MKYEWEFEREKEKKQVIENYKSKKFMGMSWKMLHLECLRKEIIEIKKNKNLRKNRGGGDEENNDKFVFNRKSMHLKCKGML